MSAVLKEEVTIREKIIHLLKVYPIISPTMLQAALGAYVKPIKWRPVLVELIADGTVVEENESIMTPFKRYNSYTKLRLANVN